MTEWKNGKRVRPRSEHCEAYCEQYPCNRTECDRRRLIINGQYKMSPAAICDYHDQRERKRQWQEPRVTFTN